MSGQMSGDLVLDDVAVRYGDVEESLRSSVRSTLARSLDEDLPARLADEPDTDGPGES